MVCPGSVKEIFWFRREMFGDPWRFCSDDASMLTLVP